jgi:hypothetical protein
MARTSPNGAVPAAIRVTRREARVKLGAWPSVVSIVW